MLKEEKQQRKVKLIHSGGCKIEYCVPNFVKEVWLEWTVGSAVGWGSPHSPTIISGSREWGSGQASNSAGNNSKSLGKNHCHGLNQKILLKEKQTTVFETYYMFMSKWGWGGKWSGHLVLGTRGRRRGHI